MGYGCTLVHIGHILLHGIQDPLLLTESDGTGIIMHTVSIPGPPLTVITTDIKTI